MNSRLTALINKIIWGNKLILARILNTFWLILNVKLINAMFNGIVFTNYTKMQVANFTDTDF